MALSFSEKGRGDIGGRDFRCYQVTADGTTVTINASDIDMHYIETAMIGNRSDPHGEVSVNLDSLDDAAGSTIAVSIGCTLGDFTLAACSVDLVDMTMASYVQAATDGEIRLQNESASAADLDDTTFRMISPRNIGLSTRTGTYIVFSPALRSGDVFHLAVIGY